MPLDVKEKEGVVFPTKEKKTENSPDFSGNLKVEGVVYSVACWQNTSKAGKPYITMRMRVESDEYVRPPDTASSSSNPF